MLIGNTIGNFNIIGSIDKKYWLISKVLSGIVGGVSSAEIKKSMRTAWGLEGAEK